MWGDHQSRQLLHSKSMPAITVRSRPAVIMKSRQSTSGVRQGPTHHTTDSSRMNSMASTVTSPASPATAGGGSKSHATSTTTSFLATAPAPALEIVFPRCCESISGDLKWVELLSAIPGITMSAYYKCPFCVPASLVNRPEWRRWLTGERHNHSQEFKSNKSSASTQFNAAESSSSRQSRSPHENGNIQSAETSAVPPSAAVGTVNETDESNEGDRSNKSSELLNIIYSHGGVRIIDELPDRPNVRQIPAFDGAVNGKEVTVRDLKSKIFETHYCGCTVS